METSKFDYGLKGLIKDDINIDFNEPNAKSLQLEKILNELILNPHFKRRLDQKEILKSNLNTYIDESILESIGILKLKYILSKLILEPDIFNTYYTEFSNIMQNSVDDFSEVDFNYYFEESLLKNFLTKNELEDLKNLEKFYHSLKELNLHKIKKHLNLFLDFILHNFIAPDEELKDLYDKLVESNKDCFSSLKEIFSKFLKVDNLGFKNLVLENLADLYLLNSNSKDIRVEEHIENLKEVIKIYEILALETKQNEAKTKFEKLFNVINLSIKKFEKEYTNSSLTLRRNLLVTHFSNLQIDMDKKLEEIGKYLVFSKDYKDGEIIVIIAPVVEFSLIQKISNKDKQNILLAEAILNTKLNQKNLNDVASYKLLKNKKIIYEYYINNDALPIFEGLSTDPNFNETNLLNYLEPSFSKYLNLPEFNKDLSQLLSYYFSKDYSAFISNFNPALQDLIKIDEIKSNLDEDTFIYFEFILFERAKDLDFLEKEAVVLLHLFLLLVNNFVKNFNKNI